MTSYCEKCESAISKDYEVEIEGRMFHRACTPAAKYRERMDRLMEINGFQTCVGKDTCLTCSTVYERGSGCPRGCAQLRDENGEWY